MCLCTSIGGDARVFRNLRQPLKCAVSPKSPERAERRANLFSMQPSGFPRQDAMEIIISGTADIKFMYCNPCLLDTVMSFITEQTKRFSLPFKHHLESLLGKRLGGMMRTASIGTLFLISSLHRDLSSLCRFLRRTLPLLRVCSICSLHSHI